MKNDPSAIIAIPISNALKLELVTSLKVKVCESYLDLAAVVFFAVDFLVAVDFFVVDFVDFLVVAILINSFSILL
jgi:hypothetical protein